MPSITKRQLALFSRAMQTQVGQEKLLASAKEAARKRNMTPDEIKKEVMSCAQEIYDNNPFILDYLEHLIDKEIND